jgi:hypothetical protein
MTPADFLSNIIKPGLEQLHALGGPAVTTEAERFMLAIAMQESGPKLDARYQGAPSASAGPARGWWQFEQGGGVRGVLQHSASSKLAKNMCEACTVVASDAAVWRALEGHDVLAAVFARLYILTEPHALPTTQNEAWSQYLNLWRPGKPHPENWPANWQMADKTCRQFGKESTIS